MVNSMRPLSHLQRTLQKRFAKRLVVPAYQNDYLGMLVSSSKSLFSAGSPTFVLFSTLISIANSLRHSAKGTALLRFIISQVQQTPSRTDIGPISRDATQPVT
jgi:hypothetical protein